ncbi:MAG: zinc ribbon domain-containing protein [candidate division Zixibacteria bacterium]|nr:zinc ribbon domain-containing protein [candidate division Zixibacteria bacterium]
MPTYEYKCDNCGYEFEEFQKMSDSAIEVCPECKGKTRRMISGGAGFLLKGSGFYSTDYRSESYKKDAANDSPSKAIETKSSSSKGDKKSGKKKNK